MLISRAQMEGARVSHLVGSGLTYALLFGGPGAFTPFFGLWLKAHGFAAAQIGLLIAVALLARPVLAPAIGLWAGRFRNLRAPFALLCFASALGCAALLGAKGFGATLAAWLVICTCAGAGVPLLDVATLHGAGHQRSAFGGLRAIASAATITGAISLGFLLNRFGPFAGLLWSASGALLAAGGAWIIQDRTRDGRSGPVRTLPTPFHTPPDRRAATFMALLAISAASLIQASHGFNSMAMLSWRARGFDEGLCGLLWETGQIADIAFLWWLSRHPQPPSRLLVLGAAGAIIRWGGLSSSPPLAMLFGLQAMHALSFTATYFASVQLIDEMLPERDGLLAQVSNWALSTGLCTGLGVIGAGALYERWGLAGYWVMCGLAGLGLLIAVALHFWVGRNAVVLPANTLFARRSSRAEAGAPPRQWPPRWSQPLHTQA